MTKDQLFKIHDITVAPVVCEWGTVHVKSMSGADRSRFKTITDDLVKRGHEADADTWLVIFTLSDEAGNRLLADADFGLVNERSASVLSVVATAALRHNGLLPEAIEDSKKN